MHLSDTNSNSSWIDRVIKDAMVDEVSLKNAILYNARVTIQE